MNIHQKDLLKRLNVKYDEKILDWGCGAGNEIDSFKQAGFVNCSGLEVDPQFARLDITINEDSIGFLEKNPETFDVIFARESIYYICKEDQPRLWLAFNSALKPNGKIIIITFNGILLTAYFILQKDLGIQLVLNEYTLLSLASKAGFVNVEVLGIKPASRTPLGFIITNLSLIYRKITITLRYFIERGFERFRPSLFTKNIVLLASKQ